MLDYARARKAEGVVSGFAGALAWGVSVAVAFHAPSYAAAGAAFAFVGSLQLVRAGALLLHADQEAAVRGEMASEDEAAFCSHEAPRAHARMRRAAALRVVWLVFIVLGLGLVAFAPGPFRAFGLALAAGAWVSYVLGGATLSRERLFVRALAAPPQASG